MLPTIRHSKVGGIIRRLLTFCRAVWSRPVVDFNLCSAPLGTQSAEGLSLPHLGWGRSTPDVSSPALHENKSQSPQQRSRVYLHQSHGWERCQGHRSESGPASHLWSWDASTITWRGAFVGNLGSFSSCIAGEDQEPSGPLTPPRYSSEDLRRPRCVKKNFFVEWRPDLISPQPGEPKKRSVAVFVTRTSAVVVGREYQTSQIVYQTVFRKLSLVFCPY